MCAKARKARFSSKPIRLRAWTHAGEVGRVPSFKVLAPKKILTSPADGARKKWDQSTTGLQRLPLWMTKGHGFNRIASRPILVASTNIKMKISIYGKEGTKCKASKDDKEVKDQPCRNGFLVPDGPAGGS
jgi:hypothetical protein